jgi:predicted P-loop ATPase
LSAPYFDLREPYGKKNIRLRRIASLCATSNEIEILNDPTGNRRNIVFEVVGKFNYSAYNALDKEQLFAQLVHLYNEGFKSELTDSQIGLIEAFTADKHGEVSIEAEMVKHFFEVPEHAGEHDFYTSSQIKNIIETNSVQRLSVKKLGMELKRLGYIRFQKSGHGFGYRISMKHPNLQRNEPDPF